MVLINIFLHYYLQLFHCAQTNDTKSYNQKLNSLMHSQYYLKILAAIQGHINNGNCNSMATDKHSYSLYDLVSFDKKRSQMSFITGDKIREN